MPPQKQNNGFVVPQIIDPPRKCIKIWIPNEVYHRGAFWGAIFELTQFFNWQQNRPEDARAVANLWFDIWSEATRENDGMTCCGDEGLVYRVNPTTGLIQQSANGGTTWQPANNTLQKYIVEPVPPITAGTSATKCDAATNVEGQVEVWIDQVTNDFDTAVSLLEFGLAVLEAILVAVVTILSAGTLTAAELLVLPTISAACAAAWGAGKAVFVAYWTTENKDKILCAAYCNIGDDGSFTDAQFSSFWNECNAQLPASPAKMLFLGFLSSVGRQGLNAMAAVGLAADSDCSSCPCAPCIDSWQWATVFQDLPEDYVKTDTYIEASAVLSGPWYYWVIWSPVGHCCDLTVTSIEALDPATTAFCAKMPCDAGTYPTDWNFGDEANDWVNDAFALPHGEMQAVKIRASYPFIARATFG